MESLKISDRVEIIQVSPHKWNVIVDGEVVFKALGKASAKRNAEMHAARHNPTPSSFAAAISKAIEEPKPLADHPPHLIIEARAGTGKTTTLIEGIKVVMGIESKLTPSEQQARVWEEMGKSRGVRSIAFVAFNKAIASELQTRVPAGCDAMTMHSMGLKAVTNTFGSVKVESYRVQNIISMILERDIRDLWKEKADVIRATEKLVGLCKMNLINRQLEESHEEESAVAWAEELDTLVAHYDVDVNGDREEVYQLVPQVLARCLDVKADRMIDFNDMIWLPVALNLRVRRYDLLLVDEAQDLNRCQQALARKAGTRLILCGDPKQAIYGFAGADAESMPRMAKELGETPAGCITLPLTVTRRCGKAIVEEAKKIVPDFDAFETNPEGIVRNARFPAKNGATPKLQEGTTQPAPTSSDYTSEVQDGDFILCRVNAPLVSQCFRFLKAGRKANIQGRDIGQGLVSLIKKQKTEKVADLVGKLSDYFAKEREKELKKRFPNEARLIAMEDREACLMAFCEGYDETWEVIKKIETIFTDDRTSPGIKLSSIHKSKGLEAKRVFFLVHKDAPCPHPMASSEWQMEQEWNLRYVAVTRAIEELVFVS